MVILFFCFLLPSSFSKGLEPRQVLLHWSKSIGAIQYELEISTSTEMNKDLQKLTIGKTKVLVKLLPGKYFYRVRGIHTLGTPGDWSETTTTVVNPFPPKALKPANQAVYEQTSIETIHFRWTTGLPGTKYLLQIYGTDRGKKKPVLEKIVENSHFEWSDPTPGQYQWRVSYPDQKTAKKFSSFEIKRKKRPERSWTCEVLLKQEGFSSALGTVSMKNKPDEDGQIDMLIWKPSHCEIKILVAIETPELWINIEGSYKKKEKKLLLNQSEPQALLNGAEGSFSGVVKISENNRTFEFETLEGPQKKGLNEKIRTDLKLLRAIFLKAQNINKRNLKIEKIRPPENSSHQYHSILFPSLGFTSYQYRQTNVPSFVQNSTTAKISVRVPLSPPELTTELTLYGTLFKLGSSHPTFRLVSFGISPRISWTAPWLQAPWKLNIIAGGYLTSSHIVDTDFGYDFYGIQLFPIISYSLNQRLFASLYLKFTPSNLFDHSQGSFFENSEIALGWTLNYFLESGHILSFSVDFSYLRMNLSDARTIRLKTSSLGVGYSF